MRKPRWRRPAAGELPTLRRRLVEWDGAAPGAVRHMFPLSCLDASGASVARLVTDGRARWAMAILHPAKVLVPCGDPELIAVAGSPSRRWRLLVGDAGPAQAVLDAESGGPATIVHHQRFFTVDPERVPDEAELPDPGLRRAETADVPVLADLAVRLHIDDEFGPDPGRVGLRGYRDRVARSVEQGLVSVVGPVGQPVCKVERSVSSARWGIQLAGIVVAPQARNAGIGRGAVAAAVRAALREAPAGRPVSLHVRAANAPAIRAYEAAGFVDREEWRLAIRP